MAAIDTKRREASQRLDQFRNRLTNARQADGEAINAINGDIAAWDRAMEAWERAVLRDPTHIRNYDWLIARFGMPDSALNIEKAHLARRVRAARRFDPSQPYSECWGSAWEFAALTGREREYRSFLDSLKVDVPAACVARVEAMLSAIAGEWDRVDSLVQTSGGALPRHGMILDAVRGRIATAHGIAVRGQDWMFAPYWQMPELLLEVIYGVPGTDSVVDPGGRRFGPVKNYVFHGAHAALLGDTTEAQRVQARLRLMRDSATSRRFERMFGPLIAVIEAGPAVRRGDWRSVIELLGPWGERVREPGFSYGGDAALVWWLLAEAHTALGEWEAASARLEAVVQPRGYPTVWDAVFAPPYSAAQFKLGQLYAQLGDTAKSLEHYTTFLDTFTDPDPEYEWMVEEARAELARLGG